MPTTLGIHITLTGNITISDVPSGGFSDDFSEYTIGQDIPTVSANWSYNAQRHNATMKSDGAGNASFAEGTSGFWRVFAQAEPAIDDNQSAEIVVSSLSGSGGHFFAPMVRTSITPDTTLWGRGYSLQGNTSQNRITLLRWASSTPATLVNVDLYTFATGDKLTLSAENEPTGVRLIGHVNDVEVINFLDTDAARIISGKVGAYGAGSDAGSSVKLSSFTSSEL